MLFYLWKGEKGRESFVRRMELLFFELRKMCLTCKGPRRSKKGAVFTVGKLKQERQSTLIGGKEVFLDEGRFGRSDF